MEHSEADFTHGICPECLTKVEMEMGVKGSADRTEAEALPVEKKASMPPENPVRVDCDCAGDRAEGNRKKRG